MGNLDQGFIVVRAQVKLHLYPGSGLVIEVGDHRVARRNAKIPVAKKDNPFILAPFDHELGAKALHQQTLQLRLDRIPALGLTFRCVFPRHWWRGWKSRTVHVT